MNYRLEVDKAFNCRPNRREAKAKDGSGRLLKTSIYFGADFNECLREARKVEKAGAKLAPGYSEVMEVRGYDYAEYRADPLRAAPRYRAKSLA